VAGLRSCYSAVEGDLHGLAVFLEQLLIDE
jgi:hypothetical protein